MDSKSPNPSVETLLHAFLPHKYVDHTHSTSVLALTDQPEGEALAFDTFGDRMAYVPYCIPGFALAKSVGEIYAKDPSVEGLILLKHGIFTFAEDARSAYELMIEMVTRAEAAIEKGKKTLAQVKLPELASLAEIAPHLRGACALTNDKDKGIAKRQILAFRTGDEILNYVNGAEAARYSQIGVVTPITPSAPRIIRYCSPRRKKERRRNGRKQQKKPSPIMSRITMIISRAIMCVLMAARGRSIPTRVLCSFPA